MPVTLGNWPRFQYFNQLEGKQERRNRTVQSCTECRRRKSKCDRKFPCGPCTLRKEEHLCVEHQRVQSEGLTGYTHLQDFDLLAMRCKELELMLLTLINDNASVLNLSRVQPYLEGVDAEIDGDEEGGGDAASEGPFDEPDEGQAEPSGAGEQEKRTGVRFEESAKAANTTATGPAAITTSSHRDPSTWYADPGQTTPGGMRLANIVHAGTATSGGESSSFGGSNTMERPATSAAAQQLLDFGSGYSAHPWNGDNHAAGRVGEEFSSHAKSRRQVVAERRTREGSSPGRDDDGVRPPFSRAPSLTEHHAALALEDMALNRSVARDVGNGRHDGSVGGRSSSVPENASNGPAMMPGTQPSWARRVRVDGLDVLPPITQAQPIVTYFMQELEWLFRIFHIPTFFHRLTVFHSQLPLVNPVTNDQAAFVALYAAIICTSLHLMDEHTLANVGVTVTQRPKHLQDLSDLVEQALVKCDWAGVPRIETLQAYIIIGPYWSSFGRLEAHLGMLGTAVKVAHNLGINRLGSELHKEATYHDVLNHFGRKWVMASDREVGRRIWWTLVELDWNASPDHQFNHITPKNLSSCAEPAHVNDESLVGHGPIIPQPLDIHTGMSFFVNRLRFLYPFQRFVESAIENGRLRYEVLIQTQTDFGRTIEDLSPFYRLNADFAMDLESYASDARELARMAAEKRVINMNGHLRILRCHRFYLPEAYHIAKYNFSKEAVLRSSKWLLNNNPTRDPIPGVPLRFWQISYSLLVATIISMLHLCHVESLEVADAAMLVRRGIDSLRVDQGSPALRASADAIQQLYDLEMAERQRKRHTQPPPMGNTWGGKRKRDEQEQDLNKFQRLVKKAFAPPMENEQRLMEQFKGVETPLRQLPPPPAARSSAFDYMLPFADHPMSMNTGNQSEQGYGGPQGYPSNPPYEIGLQQYPYGTPQGAGFQPPASQSLLGDPSVFLADENLLELMKWGASSMGPDTFGSGLWPFPGDTPSSHDAGGSTKPF
ncbi:hypothetical protein NliqN6_0055 [Naganishia liquefaciens]|uniref:Zn(2)-C6 fungal-type domain-containing protein n=1 Tax=Naganishia liquefaciens TaxID=104408 RepID=A0A8H3TMC5_9TREE|nr:hypothetical protein NliqN6_0055 [Naganishia liquefaciens]